MTVSGLILISLLTALSPTGAEQGHKGLFLPCVECHIRLPFFSGKASLRNEVGDACKTCHERHCCVSSAQSHPVDRVPTMKVPADMILDTQGRIVCITCHAFHGEFRDEEGKKRFYLRRSPGKTFCFSCHNKRPSQ